MKIFPETERELLGFSCNLGDGGDQSLSEGGVQVTAVEDKATIVPAIAQNGHKSMDSGDSSSSESEESCVETREKPAPPLENEHHQVNEEEGVEEIHSEEETGREDSSMGSNTVEKELEVKEITSVDESKENSLVTEVKNIKDSSVKPPDLLDHLLKCNSEVDDDTSCSLKDGTSESDELFSEEAVNESFAVDTNFCADAIKDSEEPPEQVEELTTNQPECKKLKSLLKKARRSQKERKRVTFNSTMTVYCDDFPEPCLVALKVKDPPTPPQEYLDWEPFDPPAEYRDLEAELAAMRDNESDNPLVLKSLNAALFEWFDTQEPDEECEEFVVHYNNNTQESDFSVSPPDGSEDEEEEEMGEVAAISKEKDEEKEKETIEPSVMTEEVDDEEVTDNDQSAPPVEEEQKETSEIEESKGEEAEIVQEPLKADLTLPLVTDMSFFKLCMPPTLEELAMSLTGGQPADWGVELGSLSSVQETDSDSSASSQDTMIMMTTEESKRNEQHIRDSYKRYESWRRSLLGEPITNEVDDLDLSPNTTTEEPIQSETSSSEVKELERKNSIIRRVMEKSAMKRNLVRMSDVVRRPRTNASKDKTSNSLVEKLRWLTDTENDLTRCDSEFKDPALKSEISRCRPNSLLDSKSRDWNLLDLDSRQKHLANVAIPSDVRDWKIAAGVPHKSVSSIGDSTEPLETSLSDSSHYDSDERLVTQKMLMHSPVISPDGDELEQFVEQYLERIERIRKRYSMAEESDIIPGFYRKPSVRGIKPRFGSTTEILKQMQSQLQPPLLANPSNARSHVTWPYVENSEKVQRFVPSHRQSALSRVLEEEEGNNSRTFENCNNINENFVPRRTKTKVSSNNIINNPYVQKNFTSPPISFPIGKDERGTPEGASSSPKMSSDSLYQISPPHESVADTEPTKEGVIYFSLKV